MLRRLRKQYKKIINGMAVEETWAFTKNWTATTWDDWADCWVRIKLDCAEHEDDTTLLVNDWKTGKFREENNQEYLKQLELYALSALLTYEHVQKVKPRLIYLDAGVIYPSEDDPIVYTREDIPRLRSLWEQRVEPMLNDKIFAPRPNNLCKWCFFRKDNAAEGGGQCEF